MSVPDPRIMVDSDDPVFHAILTEALEQCGDFLAQKPSQSGVYVTARPCQTGPQGRRIVNVAIPFRVGQALKAIRRAMDEGSEAKIVRIGPCDLRGEESVILRPDGQAVRLTDRERDLLIALARAPGRRLDRRDILETVWGYAEGVETHTVETLVYRLRQKIELDPANPVILVTDGQGYRAAQGLSDAPFQDSCF